MDFSLSSMNVLTTVIKSLRKKYNKLLTLYAAPCFSKPSKSHSAVRCSLGRTSGEENLPLPALAARDGVEVLSPPPRDVTRGWDHPTATAPRAQHATARGQKAPLS